MIEKQKVKTDTECSSCYCYVPNIIYRITEEHFTEFGEKPTPTVRYICSICLSEEFPNQSEKVTNQIDLFNGS